MLVRSSCSCSYAPVSPCGCASCAPVFECLGMRRTKMLFRCRAGRAPRAYLRVACAAAMLRNLPVAEVRGRAAAIVATRPKAGRADDRGTATRQLHKVTGHCGAPASTAGGGSQYRRALRIGDKDLDRRGPFAPEGQGCRRCRIVQYDRHGRCCGYRTDGSG